RAPRLPPSAPPLHPGPGSLPHAECLGRVCRDLRRLGLRLIPRSRIRSPIERERHLQLLQPRLLRSHCPRNSAQADPPERRWLCLTHLAHPTGRAGLALRHPLGAEGRERVLPFTHCGLNQPCGCGLRHFAAAHPLREQPFVHPTLEIRQYFYDIRAFARWTHLLEGQGDGEEQWCELQRLLLLHPQPHEQGEGPEPHPPPVSICSHRDEDTRQGFPQLWRHPRRHPLRQEHRVSDGAEFHC